MNEDTFDGKPLMIIDVDEGNWKKPQGTTGD